MRCRTLARELQRHGTEVSFLCRRQHGDMIGLLSQEFTVLALPEQSLSACDELEGRDLYASWLGCTQEQDAFECLKVLNETGTKKISWLVVDHYGLDSRWEAQMIVGLCKDNVSPSLLAIDDLADREHQADLLVDQNFFGKVTYQRYQKLLRPQSRQLLGPYYALLGEEYARIHPLVPERKELKRVLVFFGGVDPENLTSRALNALMDTRLLDLAVDVVLGHQAPHREVVERLVSVRQKTTLHYQLPSLAGLISRADLGIGASGATTWERSCLGLPSLVVTSAANQLPFAQVLDRAGYFQLLGDVDKVSTEQIRLAVLKELKEKLYEKRVIRLTDGWGASRIVMAMLGYKGKIRLRKAMWADEALLLHWANDPQVRANSFSPDPIEEVDHHRWFHKSLKDPNCLMLIAKTKDGCPIGQIRFDLKSDRSKPDKQNAIVDLSLDRCARGQGHSYELVRLGLIAMKQQWGEATNAVAEVLPNNRASNACFARAGFTAESDLLMNDPTSRKVKRWRWRQLA